MNYLSLLYKFFANPFVWFFFLGCLVSSLLYVLMLTKKSRHLIPALTGRFSEVFDQVSLRDASGTIKQSFVLFKQNIRSARRLFLANLFLIVFLCSGLLITIIADKAAAGGDIQWTADGLAVTTNSSDQTDPQLVLAGTTPYIFWIDERDAKNEIYRSLIIGGTASTNTKIIEQSGSETHSNLQVINDSSDNFITAWNDNRSDGGNIYVEKVNNSGVRQWGGISTAVSVAGGSDHSCAVLENKTVKCWGSNSNGQLGDGTTNDSNIPILVSGITTATKVSVGEVHSCALLDDQTIKCWGGNDWGELGDGTTTSSYTPVSVLGIDTAVTISSGRFHSCALLADQTIKCWGYNSDGQLGNGTNDNSLIPVLVSNITTATQVSAGQMHSCAILEDKTAKCWGVNSWGQLGNGNTNGSNIPVFVSGINTAISITAGGMHSCAVLEDNTAQCWGYNGSGQLGDGTLNESHIPVFVSDIITAITISSGLSHSCALLEDKTMKCWGWNWDGQLGNGFNIDSSIPVLVSNITTATTLSVGRYHGCAVLEDKTIKCWGENGYGQLGNGRNNSVNVPVSVGITSGVPVCTASGSQTSPKLLADGSGGVFVVWKDSRSGTAIYGQHLNSSGVPLWTGNGKALVTGIGERELKVIVSDGAGGFILGFFDYRDVFLSIYAQRFDLSGNSLWAADKMVFTYSGAAALNNLEGVADGAGGVIFIYSSSGIPSAYLMGTRLDSSGNYVWDAAGDGSLVISQGTIASSAPKGKIVSDGNNNFIIAYDDDREGIKHIYAQKINLLGASQWIANGITVCSAVIGQNTPQLVADGNGGAVIIWQDERNGGGLYNLYVQEINSTGTAFWTANGVPIGVVSGTPQTGFNLAYSSSGGNAVFVWTDNRNGNADIYAQSVEGGSSDTTNPAISALSPADDSTGRAVGANLIITFDEAVDAESGYIKLYKSDNNLIEQFDVITDITGSGTTTITIDPTADLELNTSYFLQIDATAFDDSAGNSFAGISDETTWSFTTVDYSFSWIERTSSTQKKWRSIASSADGVKLVAGVYRTGYIYTSGNSGATWTQQMSSGSKKWYDISSSADGVKLAAITFDEYLYISNDSGATWTAKTILGLKDWQSITSSSDGVKLAAATYGGYIYTSGDSGATWTEQTSADQRDWQSITSSSDGVKLAAVTYGGYIYTSGDSGATWTEQILAGQKNWMGITSSSDGVKLAAVTSGGYIYTSSDSGATWTEQTLAGQKNWYKVASSSDGVKLVAVVDSGYIYTSADSGITWTEQTDAGSRVWWGIASSSDGVNLAGAVYDGYIYTASALLANTAPVIGYLADNVIPAAQVSVDSSEIATITFRGKDADGDAVTLNTFEYSVDGGATFNAPANGDSSQSIYLITAGDSWADNLGTNYSTAISWTGTVYNLKFNTRHADLAGLNGVDQSDVQIRFKANDETVTGNFGVSESFTVNNANTAPVVGYSADNIIPAAQISQSTSGDGIMTITFRAKDAEADNVTLNTFEYSVDGGTTFNAPTNGDSSQSIYITAPGDSWSTNAGTNYSSGTDWTGTAHSFKFNTKHADVSGLNSVDQSDVRIRFKANDGTVNSTLPGTSENFSVDNLNPAALTASDIVSRPTGGDTTVTIGGSFTENNPNTNNFYLEKNSGGYGSATAGDTNTSAPANQATAVGSALDGDDCITKVKIVHTDDFGNQGTDEQTSPSLNCVKPYTPQTPTIESPASTSLKVIINENNSETGAVEYAIFETTNSKYAQANGTLGDSAVWQTYANFGGALGITITGLSPNTTYTFKVKSRNPTNGSYIESNYSGTTSLATSLGRRIDSTPPAAPTNIVLSLIENNKVKITWKDPTANDLSSIKIFRNHNSMSNEEAVNKSDPYVSAGKGTQVFIDHGVVAEKTYKYVLRAQDVSGNYTDSIEYSIFVPKIEIIAENKTKIITTKVWLDANQNGVKDSGEKILVDIAVSLYEDMNNSGKLELSSDRLVATVKTNSSGVAEFGGVPAGKKYLLYVDEQTLPQEDKPGT